MSRYRSKQIPASSRNDIAVADVLKDFLLYHARSGHSENYLRELRSYLIGGSGQFGKRRVWLPLVAWAATHQLAYVRQLSKDAVGAYLDYTRKSASKSDYGKVCAILRRFLRFLVQEEFLKQEPLRIVQPKRLKAEIKVFTTDEMARLHAIVAKENVRDQAIFMLLLDTGIRASELCNLKLHDVRWERQELIIRPEIAKNRSVRIIPLHGSMTALRRYRVVRGDQTDRCDKLFLSFYYTPVIVKNGARRPTRSIVFCDSGLTRNGLFFAVQKWGRLAGVMESRCSPHTFRHFFAQEYLRRGGNIVTLQRLLGHSRLDTTQRYLNYREADLQAEHERFSPAAAFLNRRKRR